MTAQKVAVKQTNQAFTINFAERTEFPLLEEGEHNAIIHSMELTEGPKGNYLRTRFSVDGDALNRQAWMNISLADGALWRIKKMGRDLGVARDKKVFKSRREFELNIVNMFVGKACSITIQHQEFEGVVRNRVTNVGAPDRAPELAPA